MRHGSLFSGVGGFDLAAELAGYTNVFSCEIEPFNQNILRHYWPEAVHYGDITTTDFSKHRGEIDIITGGFPCQDLSISNTKKGAIKGIAGKRTGLWRHYERAIREIRPSAIVFENSPMLLSGGLEHVLCDLSRIGYDCEWRCFYATQFGFPHGRKRIYGVAYSVQGRFNDIIKQGGILRQILPQGRARQANVPMPTKRFNAKSNYSSVRMDDGFPKRLHNNGSIQAMGNAIVPHIALSIFQELNKILSESK